MMHWWARVRGGLPYLLLVLVVWGAPLVAAVWARPASLESEVLWPRSGEMRTAVIGERTDDGAQGATLALIWSPPTDVPWTGDPGVVSEVLVSPGDNLIDGTPLLTVDGVTIVAQVSGRPLFRNIGRGMSGPDVEWLDQYLVSRGTAASTTLDAVGRTTSATTSAVRTWQLSAGVARADGTFRVSYTLWVGQLAGANPDSTPIVGKVHAAIGQHLVTGVEVLSGVSRLIDATLTPMGPTGRQWLVSQGPLVLTIGSSEIDVHTLSLGATDLASIEHVVPADEMTLDNVGLRRQAALHVGAVPASAVLTGSAGQSCLFVAAGSNEGLKSVQLNSATLVSSEPGVVYVDAELIGLTVVTNPTIALDMRCS